jgi:hypothetical protein
VDRIHCSCWIHCSFGWFIDEFNRYSSVENFTVYIFNQIDFDHFYRISPNSANLLLSNFTSQFFNIHRFFKHWVGVGWGWALLPAKRHRSRRKQKRRHGLACTLIFPKNPGDSPRLASSLRSPEAFTQRRLADCPPLGSAAPMEPRVGNKYRLGRKLGSGSFGEIFLGLFRGWA